MANTFYRSLAVFCGAILLAAPGVPAPQGEKPGAEPTEADLVAKAFRMRMDGRVDDAKQFLEQGLEKSPGNAAAWLELARLEFQRGGKTRELDSAQRAIEKAVAAAPDSAVYQRWAARIAVYNAILTSHSGAAPIEQFKKAAAAGERAVKLDPDDREARLLLIDLYDNNPPDLGGDQARAKHHVEALEKRSPIDGAVARCHFSLEKDPERKIALWSDLAKRYGDDARVHENLALESAWAGDVEKATLHADRALELDPAHGRVLLDLARAFALERKLEPAERFARRYLALDPPAPRALRAWAYMALGRIAMLRGEKEASAKLIEKARELDSYCWFTMSPPPPELFDAP